MTILRHGLQSHAEPAENRLSDEGEPRPGRAARCSPGGTRWASTSACASPRPTARCGSCTTGRRTPTATSTWGHVLNKVLKDVVVKSRSMLGYNAVYVPGWDCHGLPIEHQVDKELGLDTASIDVRQAMDPIEKRRRCREYAGKYIDIQRAGVPAAGRVRRLGQPVPHDGARLSGGDRARVRALRRSRASSTRASSPCTGACTARRRWPRPRSSTRSSARRRVYVKFPLVTVTPPLDGALGGRPAFAVIWTTTPWTLPANLAIAVHPAQSYTALDVGGDVHVVATARSRSTSDCSARPARARPSPWRLRYAEPISSGPCTGTRGSTARARSPALTFVAMDAGTGLVHIAPGHGEEDYELGRSARPARSTTRWTTTAGSSRRSSTSRA